MYTDRQALGEVLDASACCRRMAHERESIPHVDDHAHDHSYTNTQRDVQYLPRETERVLKHPHDTLPRFCGSKARL